MSTARRLATTFSIALLGCAAIAPGLAGAAGQQVLAQDLLKVRASGKVITALWTARPDSYTLQLVMPVVPALLHRTQAARVATATPPAPRPPQVQVWLLKADGSVLVPTSTSIPPLSRQYACGRCVSYELSYSFAPTTGREAVAAAVRIDDDFYVEALKPLAGD